MNSKIFIILGNQLFPTNHIKEYKKSTFFMCEDFNLCSFQKHHKLKLILFLSSMRSYADILQKESDDTYVESFFNAFDEISSDTSLASPDIFANRSLSDEINFEMSPNF